MTWNGWGIDVEVRSAHISYDSNVDVVAEGEAYAEFLREFLRKRFDGAEVAVWCEHGVEGAGAECSLSPIDGRELTFSEEEDAELTLSMAIDSANREWDSLGMEFRKGKEEME